MCIHTCIYVYTSVNPCISMHGARQSRGMCNRGSIRGHGFFEQSSKITNAISSTASRLHAFATPQLRVFTSSRENDSKFALNIDQNIPEKFIPKSMKNRSKIDENRFLEPYWLKMTPPWSHLGPRWPRGSNLLSIFDRSWGTKNRFKNQTIFRHP